MTSPTQSDKTVEPMSEDDYWRIMLNNYEKDGDLPYGDKQRLIGLNEFITARDNRMVQEAEQRHLKSVLRSRAKTNPDMTVKELYEGIFEQKHDYRGATHRSHDDE